MSFLVLTAMLKATVFSASLTFADPTPTETPMTYTLAASDKTQISIKTTIKTTLVIGDSEKKVAAGIENGTRVLLTRTGGFRAKGVSVVLMNLCQTMNGEKFSVAYACEATRTANDIFTANISFAGCKIHGKTYDVNYLKRYSDMLVSYRSRNGRSETCRQELAAVVDGAWLKDPMNGNSNFQLQF